MSNLKLLKILNPIMALAVLGVAIGLVLSKTAIIPSLQGSVLAFEIHETCGIIFFLCAVCHIILNWNWIKIHVFGNKTAKKTKKK